MFRDATFVYKDVWKTRNCEILHAGQEFYNAVHKFAMKVVKNNEAVGHLRATTREFCGILSLVAKK